MSFKHTLLIDTCFFYIFMLRRQYVSPKMSKIFYFKHPHFRDLDLGTPRVSGLGTGRLRG